MFKGKELLVAVIVATMAFGSVHMPGHAQPFKIKPKHLEALEDEEIQIHPGIVGKTPKVPGQLGNTDAPILKIPDGAKDALGGKTGTQGAPGVLGKAPTLPGQTGNSGGPTPLKIPDGVKDALKGKTGTQGAPGILGNSLYIGPQPALVEPAPGSTLAGPAEKFAWDPNGVAVESYALRFGATVGGDEYGEFDLLPGSYTAVAKGGLPTNGSAVYVRFSYKVAGAWSSGIDYQYTAAPPQLPGQTGNLVDAMKPKGPTLPGQSGNTGDPTKMQNPNAAQDAVKDDSETFFEALGPSLQEMNETLMAASTPVITQMLNSGGYSPGKEIVFKGKNFRLLQGRVLMYGNFPKPVELFTTWVSDTEVRATIPADITGVVDHLVELELINELKVPSKRRKTWFVAAREVKKLNRSDPAINLVKCADDPNINRCYGAHQGDKDINADDCVYGFTLQGKFSHTIWGFHSNCGDFGNDFGKDWWFFGVKNGWELHSVYIDPTENSYKSGNVVPDVNDFASKVGKSIWDVQVLLNIEPGDFVSYNYTFNIIGPKGVPHF